MLIQKKIPFQYLFKKIKNDILRVFLFSLFFQVLKNFFADYLPQIPLQLPTVLGTSISLILAFQLNHSYDRWWEARKIWGAIVNDSRTLVLQLKGFVKTANLPEQKADNLIKQMAYRQIGWCYSLGQSLRKLDPLHQAEAFIATEELPFVMSQTNKPFALLAGQTKDLKFLHEHQVINDYQQIQIDQTLVRLCESMGRAERINSTVFPVTYRIFVHLFIYLFLLTLSLALVETIGLAEIPFLVLISSTFFLLEKTATYLQEPFKNKPTDTPVTAIARTIEINIKQLLQEPDIPQPVAPEAFYLL